MERVAAAGFTIAYERAGHGPPLLLLHGGASDAGEWRGVAGDLARDHDVVAWDAPGCARLQRPARPVLAARLRRRPGGVHGRGRARRRSRGGPLVRRRPRDPARGAPPPAGAGAWSWSRRTPDGPDPCRRRRSGRGAGRSREELRNPDPGARPVPAMTMLDAFAQADLRGVRAASASRRWWSTVGGRRARGRSPRRSGTASPAPAWPCSPARGTSARSTPRRLAAWAPRLPSPCDEPQGGRPGVPLPCGAPDDRSDTVTPPAPPSAPTPPPSPPRPARGRTRRYQGWSGL